MCVATVAVCMNTVRKLDNEGELNETELAHTKYEGIHPIAKILCMP